MAKVAHQTLPLQCRAQNEDERFTRSIEMCQGILQEKTNCIKSSIPIKEYSNKFLRQRWARTDLMPVKTKLDPQKRFNVILRKKQKISKHCQREAGTNQDPFIDCMRKENDPAAIFLPQKPRSRIRTEGGDLHVCPVRDIENELLIDNPLPSNLLTPSTPLSKQLQFRRHHQGHFTPLSHTKRVSQSKGLDKVGKSSVKSVSKLNDRLAREVRSDTYSPQNFQTKKIVPGVKSKTVMKDVRRMTHNGSVRVKVLTEPEEDFQLNGWETAV